MLRTTALALAGGVAASVAVTLPSASGAPQWQVPLGTSVAWPAAYDGNVSKMRPACLYSGGPTDLVLLAGENLVVLSDPLSAPRLWHAAEGVRDFAVLPAVGGVSRIVMVGDFGLRISGAVDSGPEPFMELVNLATGDWRVATHVDGAGQSGVGQGGVMRIAGVVDTQVLVGDLTLASDSFVDLAFSPIDTGLRISHLAVADAHSSSGVEIAAGDESELIFYGASGTSYMSQDTSASFFRLARIDDGADGLDSFGVFTRHAATDTFNEIAGTTVSATLYSGSLRLGDIAFARVGLDARTDMAVTALHGEVVFLHGQPESSGGWPFDWDLSQWSVLPIDSSLSPTPPSQPLLACGDFDRDGDGDLVLFGEYAGKLYLSIVPNPVRSELSADVVNVTFSPGTDPGSAPSTELGVSAIIEVRQPPVFEGELPTHARVRLFAREYGPGLTEEYIVVPYWYEDFLELDLVQNPQTPPYQVSFVVSAMELPPGLNVENTLLYLEVVPQIHAPEGGVLQRANATSWVGSAEPDLLELLICQEEVDEFSEAYCATDGAILVPVFYRRREIRRIPPTTAP